MGWDGSEKDERTGDDEAREGDHMQIQIDADIWSAMRVHTYMHTPTEKLARCVQQQQSELPPSDDTACEDDVGSPDSQGHP